MEPAPTNEKVAVNIIFPEKKRNVAADKPLKENEIVFGSLAGKISLPDNFNDELDELSDYM